ncbi:hypothetical protein SAMN06265795_101503 [Noviherbaspirillum humi]|uniref:Uncharacterized protein n=1 Tax=Noviherbaspirillum humi TaxID=1688639 RepID=A0A239CL18_9BURK|nr:hypothetical protein [Noviherbaspirillum humi]SNS20381.1 hypothetical protein SAMN06265795_101503 [Noviherbaspirillum humi]
MEQIWRLRRFAELAIEHYEAAAERGREALYPQWAKDILDICRLAEERLAGDQPIPGSSWMSGIGNRFGH